MADVLDQSEVDALLAAVDGGQVGQDASPTVFGRMGRQQAEVHVYDFKRPERVSKDQMRALEALHEGFGRNFGAALSGYLRTIVEVSVANIEQLTYSEFIHSLPNPTCFNLLKAEQLDGQLCLEVSPLIIYPIIDRLLGGSNADLFIPQRPLTQIEQRLVQRITDRATHHLSEAWSNLTPVTFSVQDFESNPQLVQIVPPNEVVVVVGFELKMGGRAGTMSLCIPYNVIEPIMGVLSNQSWFTYQKKELFKIMDLGEYWEKETGLPIPLGGIVVNRKFSGTSKQINNLIRQSIEYAFSNYPTMPPYVIEHSQEMDESVMRQHIDLYVNNYSADLGADGKQAVKKFLEVYSQLSGESFDFTSVFPDNE